MFLRAAILLGGIFFLLMSASPAAEVRLKDGTRLQGHLGAQGETTLYFVPYDESREPRTAANAPGRESVPKPDVLEPRPAANAPGRESVPKPDVLEPRTAANAPGRESVPKPDVLEPRWISISDIESIQLDPVLTSPSQPQPVLETGN